MIAYECGLLTEDNDMRNLTPLRFPGNKRWLVDYVKDFIRYHNLNNIIAEPYGGSVSISFGLLEMNIITKAYINDKNPMIYAFWYSVFNLNQELIDEIKNLSRDITVERYYELKENYKRFINSKIGNNDADMVEYASTFLFLNRTSYSGIVKGGPIGGKKQESKYKIYCRFGVENIINKINYLYRFRNHVKLYNLDGIEFIKEFHNEYPNSLLYIDPPYFKAGKDLYDFYFNVDNHIMLANLLLGNEISNPWLVSYDDSEFIKELYAKIGIFSDRMPARKYKYLPRKYSISSNKRNAYEIFFSNKKIPPH
ncbi:DNA methyltransferase [Thermoplasma sp. Kam2015]|uniref:DNA adenine methylase n=1 Tax=Thermoplasma sp. Kam2015 TaxID=2094122 RepID=UPI000D834FEC|nr:DNA adenine methylase [Thermoplasma sp. Kam2015]PYB67467.1 DNA methyltransferase [Thermoplasma sp. Kam2015]